MRVIYIHSVGRIVSQQIILSNTWVLIFCKSNSKIKRIQKRAVVVSLPPHIACVWRCSKAQIQSFSVSLVSVLCEWHLMETIVLTLMGSICSDCLHLTRPQIPMPPLTSHLAFYVSSFLSFTSSIPMPGTSLLSTIGIILVILDEISEL